MPNWITGEVVAKRVWTKGLFTLRVRAEGIEPYDPGQFLHLALPAIEHPADTESSRGADHQTGDHQDRSTSGVNSGTGEIKRVNRPYSVASPHGDELEFFIVVVPDGLLTPRLWTLQVGDALEVSESGSGRFTLKRSPPAENLWLVATGTGLAPYIAMLRTDEPWNAYRNIVVVHGVRHHLDLAYTEELNAYVDRFPGRFHLVQSLTRERQEGTFHGRIPRLFHSGEIESTTGIACQADNSTVLLCGNPAMLDSMETVLGERSMIKHRSKAPGQIVLERYW